MRWCKDFVCGFFFGIARPALVLLAVAVTAACAGLEASSVEHTVTRQKSSHDAAFFRDLLAGRVWVYQRVAAKSPSIRNYSSAAYLNEDGRLKVCTSWQKGAVIFRGKWRVVSSEQNVAQFNSLSSKEEPDPAQRRKHTPIFYDPETGQFHNESLLSGDTWGVHVKGWVQESWPAAHAAACPELVLAGVPVNEKQRSVVFSELKREDPQAPLRHFPGSERAIPGARGLAVSGHEPTYPVEALRMWLEENNGTVVRGGRLRYALSLGPRGDEVWLLDGDSDEIADTIELFPSEDGNGIVLQFTKAQVRVLYRLGYPLGLMSTGERYGAMELTDWLVERGEPVALPFMDRENVGFRFLADGRVRVGTRAGIEIGGEWWWSKGMLHLRVEGIDSVNTFEWQALARHVGWDG